MPMHLHLSPSQVSIMIEAGQQPGVPFHLVGDSAHRPQGSRVKVKFSENLVSLRKNSLKVTDCGDGSFSVSFHYDASVLSKAMVFIGAKDRSSGRQMRYAQFAAIMMYISY